MSRMRKRRHGVVNYDFKLNTGDPFARYLIGWWPLMDTGFIERARHMPFFAFGGARPTNKITPIGRMTEFNGANIQYKNYAFAVPTLGYPVTFMCWIDLPTASEHGKFLAVGDQGGNNGYAFGVGNDSPHIDGNELVGEYIDVSFRTSTTAIGTGIHHVAFVILRTRQMAFYIDGKRTDTAAAANINAPGDHAFMGGAGLDDVSIMDMRLYYTLMTDVEIAEIYSAQRWALYGSSRRALFGEPPAPAPAAASRARWLGWSPPTNVQLIRTTIEETYIQKVQALNPIAYWTLAEHEGTMAFCAVDPNQNGTYSDVTLNQAGIGDGNTCPFYDGVKSYTNLHSATFAAAFDGGEGTVSLWARVAHAGVWTDGANRDMLRIAADGVNSIELIKAIVNNRLTWTYTAGGTNDVVLRGGQITTEWMHIALTWSVSSGATGELVAYYDGVQTGATQVGLGVWAGAPAVFATLVGAATTAPINLWSGTLGHAAVWDRPLTPAEISSLAVVP